MIKKLVPLLLLFAFAGLATAQDDAAGEVSGGTGDIVMFVFDGDAPLAGARLIVDGQEVSETGDDGGLFTSLTSGRHKVVVQFKNEKIVDLDLLTAEGEQIQIIVNRREGQKAEVDIESTGAGPVLVQEGESADDAATKRGLLEGIIKAGAAGPVVGDARVTVLGLGRAVRTNEDGVFQIELPPGNYSLKVSHADYDTQTIDNLRVIPGKAVTANITMSSEGIQLADYVVTADYIEGSIASELSLQRESTQVISVIGAEQISRTGDSDAAEALQRVSGLTLEQGKYVVVRGQPFRYTLTQFNGLPLPSPDPIIQAIPLDLFPDTILSNIQVQKSYSVDQPGNFGGGLIGLHTRSVPDEDFFEFKVSTGGNSRSTLDEGLTYDGSEDDYLGDDAGDRALPSSIPGSPDALFNLSTAERQAIGRSFNDIVLFEEEDDLPPDVGFEAVGGKSFPTEHGTFGFVATGAYSHQFRNEEELERTFLSGTEPSIESNETRTDREVQISGLLGLSGKWDSHELISNTFFIRDSQDRAQFSTGFNIQSGASENQSYLLEFQKRELFLTQLIGEHEFEYANFDWRVQTANTDRDRPDRRTYSYDRAFGSSAPFTFSIAENYTRNFNVVEEDINSAAADLEIPLQRWINSENVELSLTGGFDIDDRERDSRTRRFTFRPQAGQVDLTLPNVEQIINDGTIDDDADIVVFREVSGGNDVYTADVSTEGLYLGMEGRYSEWLQVVGGLRRTNADYSVITGNGINGGFDESFTLPALSITGYLSDSMQVRAAFGETVSYPRIVELAEALFFDPDTGEVFIGNADLEPTEITSYDLRWEWYPTALETVTAGIFYKDLTNTIEEQFIPVGGGNFRTTFTNGESGEIYGLEVGTRLGLDRLHRLGVPREGIYEQLAKMYVQADIAITDSEVDLGSGFGAATNRKRPLTGQADRVYNLQLGYDGAAHDLTLILNHVGERLDRGGAGGLPDIYQEPTTFIDLTYSLTIPDILPVIGDVPFIGEGQLKLKGRNLLNEEEEYRQGSDLQRLTLFGRTYSASLKWNFN